MSKSNVVLFLAGAALIVAAAAGAYTLFNRDVAPIQREIVIYGALDKEKTFDGIAKAYSLKLIVTVDKNDLFKLNDVAPEFNKLFYRRLSVTEGKWQPSDNLMMKIGFRTSMQLAHFNPKSLSVEVVPAPLPR